MGKSKELSREKKNLIIRAVETKIPYKKFLSFMMWLSQQLLY